MATKGGSSATDTEPEDILTSIGDQIVDLGSGDRASLRRLYLTHSSTSRSREADGVVIGLLHGAGLTVPRRSEDFEVWRLIMHVAAVLSGTAKQHPHSNNGRLGLTLFDAGISENRLLRLLSARGPLLHDQIRLIARSIEQAKEVPTDLWPIFHLVGRDNAQADAARLCIARDFYAALGRSEGGKP